MNAQQAGLYQRIQQFSLDAIDANLPFSKRLARDNGWTHDYAKRVVQEYKKFVFLAVVAGHPVTPSDQVDQVWHLHLLYTQSYWQEFCSEVLRVPLHHNPTKGGQQEQGKFIDWYSNTLASYDRLFQQQPPADIWSPPKIRFGREIQFQRVNTQQHWIIPKPDLSLVWRALGSNDWGWLAVVVGLGIVLWELPAFASTSLAQVSFAAFLPVYVVGAIASFTGFCGMRVLFHRSPPLRDFAPLLLAAGMFGLFLLGTIRLLVGWSNLPGSEFLDFYLLSAIAGIVADMGMARWFGVASSPFLISSRSVSARIARSVPFISLLCLYGLGLTRIGLGISRGKPTGLIVLLCLGVSLYLLWQVTRPNPTTPNLPLIKPVLTLASVGLALMLMFVPGLTTLGIAGMVLCALAYDGTRSTYSRSSNRSRSGTTCVSGSCGDWGGGGSSDGGGGGDSGGSDGGGGGCGGCGGE